MVGMEIERIVRLEHRKYVDIHPKVLYELPTPCEEIRLKRGAIAAFAEINQVKAGNNYRRSPAGAKYVRCPEFRIRVRGPHYGELDWYNACGEPMTKDPSADPGSSP